MHFYGEPAGTPSDVDGPLLASFDEATQYSDGNYALKGVADWHNDGDDLEADDYLSGALDADDTGEFLTWSSRLDTCDDYAAFDEDDSSGSWCNSKEIGSDDYYTIDEAETAWTERISEVGIAPADELGLVEISATCPE